MTSALGDTCSASGGGGRTTANCAGGKRASNCPDEVCCPWETWNNQTYLALRGSLSWRYRNEKRVRHSLNILLFGPPDVPQGFASWLEAYAYDANAALTPEFVDRVTQAAINYHLIFPKDRWVEQSACVRETPDDYGFCRPSMYQPCWQIRKNRTFSVEARAAVEKVAGGKLSETYLSQMQKNGGVTLTLPGAPAFVDAWKRKWNSVVDSVPGSSPLDLAKLSKHPRRQDLVMVVDGALRPTPWLSGLLDVFDPKGLRLLSPERFLMTRPRPGASPIVARGPMLKVLATMSDESIERDEGGGGLSTGAKVAIGVGALAVGVGIVAYLRSR